MAYHLRNFILRQGTRSWPIFYVLTDGTFQTLPAVRSTSEKKKEQPVGFVKKTGLDKSIKVKSQASSSTASKKIRVIAVECSLVSKSMVLVSSTGGGGS